MTNDTATMGTPNWYGDLVAAGVGADYDEAFAALLRALASLSSDAVCLCSGRAALPYINSLRDGLSMSGRLIMHLASQEEHLREVIQQQLDADIRVAGHFQETASFCADISVHRFDLLLVELAAEDLESAADWIKLLRERASMIFLCDEQMQEKVREQFSDDIFFATAGARQQAIILTRKGMQHRRTRTGRRRTPA